MDLLPLLRLRATRKWRGVLWLVLPTVNVDPFSMALNESAKEAGAGEEERRIPFWWWIGPGGTREGRSRSPKG